MSLHSHVDWSDINSFHHENINRGDAEALLKNAGDFLLRNFSKNPGDYVLSVRDKIQHRHYIIEIRTLDEKTTYTIGNETFNELTNLLYYYQINYLDDTTLQQPVPKCKNMRHTEFLAIVQAKFDYDNGDVEDLAFKANEILLITDKTSDRFWTARNLMGHKGKILVSFVNIIHNIDFPKVDQVVNVPFKSKCPALARANKQLVPNVYQKDALRFEKGDIITITKMNVCGQWEGICNGQKGLFPFIYVDLIEDTQ